MRTSVASVFDYGLARPQSKLKALETAAHSEIAAIMDEAGAHIQAGHDRYNASTRHGASKDVQATVEDGLPVETVSSVKSKSSEDL